MSDVSDEFLAIARESGLLANRECELDEAPLRALEDAAFDIGKAWSGSSLGHQANVYYAGYQPPPASSQFSREWGFLGQFHGTTGDWTAHTAEEVVGEIETRAAHPKLDPARTAADQVREPLEKLIDRARSAGARLAPPHDDYLKGNLEELQRIVIPSVLTLARHQMRTASGGFAIRDMQALEGGWQAAGHQVALANVLHIRAPYAVAKSLATVCERIGQHIADDANAQPKTVIQLGSKVFIGHGGASTEYLKLGRWLTDRGLEWEVFDRVPTAGLSTKERLAQMLDNAQFAFLLMTPEDETAQGTLTARANVIHEVGLFQGRLGWTKAIILLEEGCDEFSNIAGLGQVRYPKGNIRAAFDEIREVLVRDGLLPPS